MSCVDLFVSWFSDFYGSLAMHFRFSWIHKIGNFLQSDGQ